MGSLPVSPPNGQFVPTSKFFQTTHPHKDHTRDAHGNAHLVTTSTAFVFMEDNDDAHFTIGSMSIPVVKGSLVRFNGARSHHTIINSGSVEMLGPFEGGWLSAVGRPLLRVSVIIIYLLIVSKMCHDNRTFCLSSLTFSQQILLLHKHLRRSQWMLQHLPRC